MPPADVGARLLPNGVAGKYDWQSISWLDAGKADGDSIAQSKDRSELGCSCWIGGLQNFH